MKGVNPFDSIKKRGPSRRHLDIHMLTSRVKNCVLLLRFLIYDQGSERILNSYSSWPASAIPSIQYYTWLCCCDVV
jgi:hypothetical protein